MPKTIFGTTEKSNFILNMKPESVERLGLYGLLAAVLLPLLSGAIISIYDKVYVIIAIGTYVSGFVCLLFFLINALRGDVSIKRSFPFWAIVALAVLAFISYYTIILNPYEGLLRGNSYHGPLTPLLGEYGRYEGLLVLFCYFGIALLAFCVKSEDTVNKIFVAFLIAGAIAGLFAVLQHIPGLGFPNAYKDLPTYAYENVYISSGTADNPIFYGAFVTLIFGVCAGCAVFLKKHRLIFAGAALLSFTTGLFTSSITPIIGSVAVVVLLFIVAGIKQAQSARAAKIAKTATDKKTRINAPEPCNFIADAALIALAALCIFAVVYYAQGIWIRDKYIAGMDGFMRKFIVGATGITPQSLYEIAWGAAIDMIKKLPLFGVGPDGFASYQNGVAQVFDSAYNDYLFTAATRGIPSLVAYMVIVTASVVTLIRNIRNTYAPILLTAIGAYLIQAFMNTSAVTVSPMFWLLIGLSFAPVLKKAAEKPGKRPKPEKAK